VTRLPVQGGPAAQISVGGGPTAIAFGDGSVWVANDLDGTVSRIDPLTDDVAATVPVGDDPDAVAVAGGTVWVANRLSSTLTLVSARTDSATRSFSLGGSPLALAVAGKGIWTATGGTLNAAAVGGTLHVVSSVPTPSIDPAVAYPEPPFEFFEGTYDTLVTYQRVGGESGLQLVPDLALTMPTVTDSGKTYSFVLRAGLRYSDGRLVKPEDFRRALERALELDAASASYLSSIVGAASCRIGRPCNLDAGITISVPANAVTFHLTAPNPNFLYQLAIYFNAPVPPGIPDHDVGAHPVPSTGPYMIGRYVPGREVVFVRNYPSTSDFFDLFFRCSSWKTADPATTTNGSFFCDPSIDRDKDLADSEEGAAPEQAAATWAAVDRAITDTAAWVPLVSLTEYDFLSSRTTNYQYNPAINGVLLDQVEVGRG
jgi:peptide/nickel transport system substrate-binding protein